VDDEGSIREMLSQVLIEEGHEVTAVESGEKALELFRKEPFPLVITDIRMEGMDGIDLLAKIKEISPDAQVIMITSYASMETVIMALRDGAYDYLIKPFEDLDLVTAAAARAIEKIALISENKNLLSSLKQSKEELERANEILGEMAIRDGLTNLYNHRYFYEGLGKEFVRSRRHGRVFSLVFVDLDHFKNYNDTHGHLEGDRVLRQLADIFNKRMRHSDLVARYGGDEFVLLLPETDREGAMVVAEDIRRRVGEYPFKGKETQPLGKITVSIGVATFPEDEEDADALVKKADQALYRAKQGGQDTVR
jgi:diguanylate cyclase (GGDEF)-like protein